MSSWQLAILAGLALVVVAGFGWYERSRPAARLVALVAALAALAVAGRLALAPIPNVVATTDIALITGYALGGAPGFAVGALAAPISNIWLGQGPWTVWQMAGWGAVGLAGAWLATVSGRRLGRWGLAAVCALAGLAYGALLDLSVMVSYGGEQSLDRYLALSARGVPFNLAHAVGNFALAAVAGPALVRMISRYRTRLEFSWRPAGALPVAAFAAAIASAGSPAPDAALAQAPADAARAAGSSVSWLAAAQNRDGGFAAIEDGPSSPAMTGWAMLGLEAAGRNPLDLRAGDRTPVAYLRSEVDRLRSPGDLERTILALAGAGIDPRRFAGTDLVASLRDERRRDGSVAGQVNLTAFFILALRAAGADAGDLTRPVRWLRRARNDDGGWGFRPEAPSDPDSTGAALQALAAAAAGADAIAGGARWLRRAQVAGGGYALATSGAVNAQSTAWAAQGLIAAGAGTGAVTEALAYLERLRAGDGHYRYSRASDQTPVWVTAQALLAVERRPLPVPAVAREPGGAANGGGGADGGGAADAPAPAPAPPPPAGAGSSPPLAELPITPGGGADGRRQGLDDGRKLQSGQTRSGQAGTSPQTATEPAPAALPGDADAGTPVETRAAEPAAYSESEPVAPYVLGGLGALALALGLGFVWYRRRLP